MLFSRTFALAATLYLSANFAVMNYFHVADHMRGIWMANVSNYLLTFTYAKVGSTASSHLLRGVARRSGRCCAHLPSLYPCSSAAGQANHGGVEACHMPLHCVSATHLNPRSLSTTPKTNECLAPASQAIINTLLSKVHIKKKAGFKPTDKTQMANPSLQIQTAFMSRLTSLTRRFNQGTLPQLYVPHAQPAGARAPCLRG